jgi:hypothetical protein
MRLRCRLADVVGSGSLRLMRTDEFGNTADADGLWMRA